uniref:Rhamnogalacturonase A/B/Epimerase-like pectate lyase domain-containing protein n=1 Tax=Tanacetum cinerariifolium TaxID=118510 RepID=A0A699GGS5_TANCI|nr:hypothetical protein [Tanacetum cinerariifolium]
MVRWWWFGPAVVKSQLERELLAMKAGGFGGVEIQPVYPMELDDPARGIRNLPYLSPDFLDALSFVNRKARSEGLRVDMTLASGWPYGGPHVPVTESAGRMRVHVAELAPGASSVALPAIMSGERLLAAFIGPGTAKSYDATALERTQLPVSAATAPGRGAVAAVQKPRVMAFYIASRTGQQVKRAALGAEGFVLDHLSRKAIDHHLDTVATPLLQAFGDQPPYAVFSDSLEVYNTDWTDDFIEQFQRRRGYDITPHLPVIYGGQGPDVGPDVGALRRDWVLTQTELVNERYLTPVNDWAIRHHTRFRSQTYGEPAVSLSSNRLVALPEGEGPQFRSFSFTRLATSAGHLFNRPVISAETWTWLHSPAFAATPLDMKVEADRMLLQGVNQFIGHGWPYTPPGVAEPGYAFYAAAVFNNHQPWWNVMPDVNAYLTRTSYLMRQGRPDNQVAVLLPNDDAYAAMTPGKVSLSEKMQHYVTPELTQQILDAGHNLDYIDADAIVAQGLRHPVLVMPHVARLAPEVLAKLDDYVRQGGRIIAVGTLPSLAPGYRDAQRITAQVVAASSRLRSHGAVRVVAQDADVGAALGLALKPDFKVAAGAADIGFVRRTLLDADIYFIANTSNRAVRTTATLGAVRKSAAWWNPHDGNTSPATVLPSVALDLAPYESRVLILSDAATAANTAPATAAAPTVLADLGSDWQQGRDADGRAAAGRSDARFRRGHAAGHSAQGTGRDARHARWADTRGGRGVRQRPARRGGVASALHAGRHRATQARREPDRRQGGQPGAQRIGRTGTARLPAAVDPVRTALRTAGYPADRAPAIGHAGRRAAADTHLTSMCTASAATFNPSSYGARGDGVTLDTGAIQQAIDAAAKEGGTVVFKPGTYLSGSIFVKSGVTLQVDQGVTILGSQNIADYTVLPTRIAGIEMRWPAALVNIYGQKNAKIVGAGTIDGDGKVFWDSYWTLRKAYEPRGLRWASDYDAQRPRLIQVFDSSQVEVGGGLLLRRSGFWTLHICYSSDVTVDGVIIRNNEGGHGPSTDGIDIDSSRDILVQNADISVNDDALCLKAGRDSDGQRVARTTENVVIRHSIIREGAAGVTFGSETAGGFRNVEAYGLTVLDKVPVGILFKSAHTRGGFGDNLRLHDITMRGTPVAIRITMNWNPSYSYATIPDGIAAYPAYWKVLATPVPREKGIAHFHDVRIWNIKATGATTAFEVSGFPEAPLDRFTFENIDIEARQGGFIFDAKDWQFSGVKLAIGAPVHIESASAVRGLPATSTDRSADGGAGCNAWCSTDRLRAHAAAVSVAHACDAGHRGQGHRPSLRRRPGRCGAAGRRPVARIEPGGHRPGAAQGGRLAAGTHRAAPGPDLDFERAVFRVDRGFGGDRRSQVPRRHGRHGPAVRVEAAHAISERGRHQRGADLSRPVSATAGARKDRARARAAGHPDRPENPEARRRPLAVVVVRCAVHGAARVGENVPGDRRAQIPRLRPRPVAGHVRSAVRQGRTSVRARRQLQRQARAERQEDLLVARRRLGAGRPGAHHRLHSRQRSEKAVLCAAVAADVHAPRPVAGRRRLVARRPARSGHVSAAGNLRLRAVRVRHGLRRQSRLPGRQNLPACDRTGMGGHPEKHLCGRAPGRHPADGRRAGVLSASIEL